MKINLNDKMPFYLQVRNSIRKKIETGEWKEGDLIPSELELAELYGVSRVTIRTAISALVKEQYLIRRPGFGTLVFQNKTSLSNFTLVKSFTHEMKEMGLPSKTMHAELDEVKADTELAQLFKVEEGTPLYHLKRVRGTAVPILYSDTYLLKMVNIPNDQEVLMGSLYAFLASKNIYFSHFEEGVTAVMATKDIRSMLKLTDDVPVLKRKRYSYDQSNTLLEYTETYYNAAHYEYRTQIYYRKR